MAERNMRKLEDLNLLDDFLFGSVLMYPEIGETFARKLLRIIFQREFGRLLVVPQKTYYGADTDLHGARLDVYLEEDDESDSATVYDVEPDLKNRKDLIASLPQRVRFYHAKIDAVSLKSGDDYSYLKKVMVIMITPFDPFGMGRMVYTLRTMCEEMPEMPYEDGARTIFLYTRGTEGNPPEELRQLLRYMEDSRMANASNKDLQEIHKMVKTVKQDGKVALGLMRIWESERILREEALEEGREKGREEGRKEGRKEGREEERVNTERERKRADEAEARANREKSRADALEEKLRSMEKATRKSEQFV